LLPRIDTRTRVVLIVHQLEARKPTNTGLIAARCLPNSAVGYRGRASSGASGSEADWAGLVPEGSQALILFPHDGATPIEAFRDSPSPVTLVVPDGTWRQAARTRTRLAAGLGGGASAPCVTVAPTATPRVPRRLRTGARPERLATLEALALALGVLEGPEVEAQLLHVFRVMTERTLWTNGRVPASAVTGGIPAGVRSHDPLGTRGAS
jgi:DTW domain-containing protein YfiP